MTDPDTPTPDQSAAPAKPQYPTAWAGREVTYHGPVTAHHGRYTVHRWRYCFHVPCDPSCAGFDYILAPLDPAAVGLEPGDAIVAHPGHMTPATRRAPSPPSAPATPSSTEP